MGDGAIVYRKVAEDFAGHEFVDHGADEFARPGRDSAPTLSRQHGREPQCAYRTREVRCPSHNEQDAPAPTLDRGDVPLERALSGAGGDANRPQDGYRPNNFPQRMKTMSLRAFGQQLRRSEGDRLMTPAPA